MKRENIFAVVCSLLILSCDGPETTVTNIVRKDGTILRKVEMKYTKRPLTRKSYRVPVDSTWTTRDSLTISEKGDTAWYLFAEKVFMNTDAINEEYLADSGKNQGSSRKAFFERRFNWFTTTLFFSEVCGMSLNDGYPCEKYLSDDEISFLKLPWPVRNELYTGPDSTKWLAKRDTIDKKTEEWEVRSIISQWAEEAGALCMPSGTDSLTTAMLRSHENKLYELAGENDNFPDGIEKIIGRELYESYSAELDSAMRITERKFDRSVSFESYTMQIIMPGKLVSHNGYETSDEKIAWDVNGDLFFTSDYIMYAESRIVNYWAIVVTGFVIIIMFFMLITRRRKR